MVEEFRLNVRMEVLRMLITQNSSCSATNPTRERSDAELAKSAIAIADVLCDHEDGEELDKRLSSVK